MRSKFDYEVGMGQTAFDLVSDNARDLSQNAQNTKEIASESTTALTDNRLVMLIISPPSPLPKLCK